MQPRRAALGQLLGLAIWASCQRRRAAGPRTIAANKLDAVRQPRTLVAALQLRAGDAVADIGAGGGYLTEYLADAVGPAGRVVATDVDDAALGMLAQRLAHRPQVQTRRVRADETGLEDDRYDGILLSHVDHLLPSRVGHLRALARALTPGGRLWIVNQEAHWGAAQAGAEASGLSWRRLEVRLPGQFVLELSRRADGPRP